MISIGIVKRSPTDRIFNNTYRLEMTQILRMEIADILTILRISQDM